MRFRQGDVGALSFADGSLDAVLSLNGFHAFSDKKATYREVLRVLKPGGTFCGCFLFYWIFMTVLMKYTEEKWLKKLYGKE